MSSLIEVESLTFGYTKDELLFEELSFCLKKGEIKSVVGESGAGKSTLFEIILGNIKPISGSVKCKKASQVFQDPYSSFHPSYKIIDQIKDVAPITNIQEELDILDLDYSQLLKLSHELSGGQLQRASILRSILMKPDVLLLDEPTSALDNVIQLEVMQSLVKKLDTIGMLLITHDLELAQWCSDEIIRI